MKSIIQVFFFDVLSKGLMAVMALVLIRFMSESEYARYTLALSLFAVVTQGLAFSFNKIYIVGFKRFNLVRSLQPLLGLQLSFLALFVIATLPFMQYAQGVYWFIVAVIFATCLSEFTKTYFQQELKFFKFSMVEIIRSILLFTSLLVVVYFLRYDLKTWQILSLQAVAMFTVFLTVFLKRLDIRQLLDFRQIVVLAQTIFRGSYRYLFAYFIVLAVLSQTDIFMLKAISDETQLATYGSAFRYYNLLLMALGAVHAVLLPSIQKITTRKELDYFFSKQTRMILLFIPLVLFGAWASQWIIPWVDMGRYPDAVTVFRILAVSSIFSFIFSPHSSLIMRFEDFKFLFALTAVALTGSVILNFFLIPPFGATGSAIATLISFAIVNGMTFLRARQHRKSLILQ